MTRKIILFILMIFFGAKIFAQTKLPSFFSNNMVLQQNEEAPVWGTDNPGITVKVTGSWGEEASVKTGPDGKWKLRIPTPGAGGPYTITIAGSEKLRLANVLIGEVWLCSGQSNMQWPVKRSGIKGSNYDILFSKNDHIRLFQSKQKASEVLLHDIEGEWQKTEPATVGNFSAVAYYYGKLLQEILNVPVGLIVTCWGGSSVEAWMDAGTYSHFKHLTSANVPPERLNKTPALLYNAMIHPFVPYTIKGVIWYQGESNHKYPEDYKLLFPAMIQSWRASWQLGDFPFYFVQIAPFNFPNSVNSAFLREAQLFTMQNLENTGMAVPLDIGNCNNVHPVNKKTVAERLAYWAFAKTYSIGGIEFSGPVYKSMKKTDEGKIILFFDYSSGGLTGFGEELSQFQIAGEDKVFYPAKAKVNSDNTLTVWNEKLKSPVAVRYAFESCTSGSLYNRAGLPASSFRTDNWDR